jgi:quinol monooxygenase YgiN
VRRRFGPDGKEGPMDEITCVYHMRVEPSQMADFKVLIAGIVSASSKEPDTLIYEYTVGEDSDEVHIIERYRGNGLLPHVQTTFAPFAREFLKMATIERLFVYGNVSPPVRAVLDGFGAQYMAPLDGFSRPWLA